MHALVYLQRPQNNNISTSSICSSSLKPNYHPHTPQIIINGPTQPSESSSFADISSHVSFSVYKPFSCARRSV
jgi:hypothetical protein